MFLLVAFALHAVDDAGLARALALESQGRDAEALQAIEALIADSPLWELPRLESARLRLKQGEGLELAWLHTEAARALAPENPRAHYLFAVVCLERGQSEQALAALQVAVALRETYADAQFKLGVLLLQRGQPSEARSPLQQAVTARPTEVPARLALAEAHVASGDLVAAERLLVSSLSEVPAARLLLWRKLAEVYDRLKRPKEAAAIRAKYESPQRRLRPLR